MSRYEYRAYEYEGSDNVSDKLTEASPDSLIIQIAEKIVALGDGIPRLRELEERMRYLIEQKQNRTVREVAAKLTDENMGPWTGGTHWSNKP